MSEPKKETWVARRDGMVVAEMVLDCGLVPVQEDDLVEWELSVPADGEPVPLSGFVTVDVEQTGGV